MLAVRSTLLAVQPKALRSSRCRIHFPPDRRIFRTKLVWICRRPCYSCSARPDVDSKQEEMRKAAEAAILDIRIQPPNFEEEALVILVAQNFTDFRERYHRMCKHMHGIGCTGNSSVLKEGMRPFLLPEL